MGNSEGGHSRSAIHAGSASDSPQSRSKPKVKSSVSTTVFYDSRDASVNDGYRTCKPDVVAGTKDIPAYYFTASQLRNVKKRSQSHDGGLNRIFSVTDGRKSDVQDMARSPLNRKSDNDAVSIICFILFLYCH